jgi:hypothetical protein
MADNRIGVARLDVPESLPSGALADPVLGLSQGVGSDRLQAYTESVGGYMLPPTLARPLSERCHRPGDAGSSWAWPDYSAFSCWLLTTGCWLLPD